MNKIERETNQDKPCAVEGCQEPRRGYSIYCRDHRYRKLRHGHPLQQPVSPQSFETERQEIARAVFGSQRNVKFAQHFIAKWDQLVQDCTLIADRDRAGQPTHTGQRKTAYWILAVEKKLGHDPRKIISPLIGLLLKLKRYPHLVLDEDALRVQVGRQVVRFIDPKANGVDDYEGIPAFIPYFRELKHIGNTILETFLPSVYQLDNNVLTKQKDVLDPKSVFAVSGED